MASNNMTPLKKEVLEKEGPEIRPDSSLLDLSDAAIEKLIRSAKKRGYVTHVQINELLSSEEVKSVQIGDILAKLSEMGVNVVETEEVEPEKEGAGEEAESERGELVEIQQPTAPAKASTKEPTGRTCT
jgi:RNA polymerase primary sigma factor